MKRENNNGFSLIELLAVTAIIAILSGMIGVAAHNARQRAYMTIARTEVQQIATAFKSYWVAKGKWPAGFTSAKELSADVLEASGLLGQGDDGMVFLDISENRFESTGTGEELYFLDPWGHPYVVETGAIVTPEASDIFETVVHFGNSDAFYYQ